MGARMRARLKPPDAFVGYDKGFWSLHIRDET
jgi:hypothetical protein